MKTARNVLFVLTAFVLACASPVLASPDNGPLLYLWFNAAFDLVQANVEFENAWALLAAEIGVMFAQYLALLWLLYVLQRLVIRGSRDLVSRLGRATVRP